MADTMPGPLTRSFTASLRRFLFAVSIPLVAALVPAVVQAQTPPDIPDPSEVLYEIRLADGSRVIARVVELDEARVVFMTAGGSRLEVERSQIRELRPARGRFEEGEFWNEDPGGTRLLFTATGRTLSRGESYIGPTWSFCRSRRSG